MRKKTRKLGIFALYIIISFFISFEGPLYSLQIWEEFPEVRDFRNFKEAKGGKGIPPQGCILEDSTRFLSIPRQQSTQTALPCPSWNYVVSMNCRRGDRSIHDIVRDIATLIPASQRHRLGIIIGVNEKVGIDRPVDYQPSWDDLLGGRGTEALLAEYNIPILLTYYQWTSFREHKDNKTLSPSAVRKSILQKLAGIGSERQRSITEQKLKEVDNTHQFPFGKAREHLLATQAARDFIGQFDSPNTDVYVHIQDADYVSYNESLKFGDFQGQGTTRLIPADETYLLSKYDRLIEAHKKGHGRLPIVVGGAHVYSPNEDMSPHPYLNTVGCKEWTRFGSEMGNCLKHIIGVQQPYGLYFHEPNTLILSPTSARRLFTHEPLQDWKAIYSKLGAGFKFGIDSEVQEFTRKLFKGSSDSVCRTGMVFSATTVLSASMKRGADPFTIEFSGTYDPGNTRFFGCARSDLPKLRGMSQEVMHPNKWMSNVSTSFASHRRFDARKVLCALFGIFDPLERFDPQSSESFKTLLINYETHLLENQSSILDSFRSLSSFYDLKKQGKSVAKSLLSLSWECGQVMRLMLLDHICPPRDVNISPAQIGKDVREFLTLRFNFLSTSPVSPTPNTFVETLIHYVPIVKELTPLLLMPVTIKQEEQIIQPASSSNVVILHILQHPGAIEEPYTEGEYFCLLGKLKQMVLAGTLTYNQITSWAGYSGVNGARDFLTMERRTFRSKESKWNKLVKESKENKLLDGLLKDKGNPTPTA